MTDELSRRGLLRGAAATAATVAAPAVAGRATAQSTDLAAWFENTTNYDGVVDRTGQSAVTVTVGAQGNNGAFAFAPAAVRVDPGTTVVWEWTGEGGTHNVAAEGGAFESEMTGEQGHTFEFTPESTGVHTYACTPHKPMGMKGALVVGDAEVGAGDEGGLSLGATTVGGTIAAGLLSPLAFGAFLFARDPEGRDR